jgi:hypothetical protein
MALVLSCMLLAAAAATAAAAAAPGDCTDCQPRVLPMQSWATADNLAWGFSIDGQHSEALTCGKGKQLISCFCQANNKDVVTQSTTPDFDGNKCTCNWRNFGPAKRVGLGMQIVCE